ncbi:hypothetical protein [Marinicella rhabdoformis]|uniref:hypothetical protein n=1 Tax=Marinicella rhabdoformis TaxID=2580566 RepID=UPI0012AED5A8|nr:hypothetical protein [Marinicella rhabdoformis]
MKYILLALVSVLTLGAISLFVIDLMDSSSVDSEQEPAEKIVHQLETHAETVSKTEPKADIKSEEGRVVEVCGSLIQESILELQEGPQTCQRHEDCELKSVAQGCGTFITSKVNGSKIDDWLNKNASCVDTLKISCSIAADVFKYQALCIKNQCEKSRVIELKADPKEFIINTK